MDWVFRDLRAGCESKTQKDCRGLLIIRGRLTGIDSTILSTAYSTGYTYDDDGWISTITYPGGRVVEYLRDTAGRVTTVRTGGGTQIVAQNITYLPFGPVSGFTHGNGLAASKTYNQDYWLSP